MSVTASRQHARCNCTLGLHACRCAAQSCNTSLHAAFAHEQQGALGLTLYIVASNSTPDRCCGTVVFVLLLAGEVKDLVTKQKSLLQQQLAGPSM